MELRPELQPPALDPVVFTRLILLAQRLDVARFGECDEEVAEFNRLAGTSFPLTVFQNIVGAEDVEVFVRHVLFRQSLTPDPSISRAEMIEIVSRVMDHAEDYDFYRELFLVNCKHPSQTDLIYWPNLVPGLPQDREPTVEEIVDLAMRPTSS